MDLETDRALVRRAQQGDRSAMQSLVEGHWPWAVRLAGRHTAPPSEAEDTVPEAFIQAFRRIRQCRADTGFAPWFARIVINRARLERRKRRLPSPNWWKGTARRQTRRTGWRCGTP